MFWQPSPSLLFPQPVRDRSGDLWFGTTQGFSRLSPAAGRAPAIPTVRIMDLRVGRERHPGSEGGDTGWQGPGREHEANYPELAPGPYRFLVKAVNSEGQPSTTPAEIDFV